MDESTRIIAPHVALVMAELPEDEYHGVAMKLSLYGRDFRHYPNPSPALCTLLQDGEMHQTTADAYLWLYTHQAVQR